jgi:demethylmenaquinone methyltransferase/2-methoxy-6-polyprenyl-1,4-benzoquinol methylase
MALRPHEPLKAYYPDEGSRRSWVRAIFDRTAGDYDRVEGLMAFGSGPWYRRRALARAGLREGMRTLDVAVGTGLVAREAATLAGDPSLVVGIDLSFGMLRAARLPAGVGKVQGPAERLPFGDRTFDFVSMGFALRHVADLEAIFAEYRRVLRPGGTVCVLEITRPRGAVYAAVLRAYMRGLIPLAARVVAKDGRMPELMRYYWDTIEACVPPAQVLASLGAVGFDPVERYVEAGIFSEYTGRRPA